jgi:hypothetical protein
VAFQELKIFITAEFKKHLCHLRSRTVLTDNHQEVFFTVNDRFRNRKNPGQRGMYRSGDVTGVIFKGTPDIKDNRRITIL